MEFMKRVFYIMICSPDDVEFERSNATKVIQAWNRENLNSDIVLVPISYEDAVSNHTIGDPQNIINEDVLSMSSMAVVIIWSTLGRKNKKGEYYTMQITE